jgi:glutamate synthase (NADPH) small chain
VVEEFFGKAAPDRRNQESEAMLPDKEKGFMVYQRKAGSYEPPEERVKHYKEFFRSLSEAEQREQAYRCMNCGIPFCHYGCPLGNQIPDFNDAVKDLDWRRALDVLHSTNNFPEFTGRVCPAPCEHSCVLGIHEPAVAIEMLEREIAEHGWKEGWIVPEPPEKETGKAVAVIGSGPCGLAAAQQLRRAGHAVTLYERADEPGGLLMYGIPAFKLDKAVVLRRIDQMKEEGVVFQCSAEIGENVPVSALAQYDAVLIAIGSTTPRTFAGLNVPGSDLKGIYPAMEFLPQQTRRVLGKAVSQAEVLATNKNVVVIGGGDTGSDCVGTSLRQNCKSLVNIELLPQPPSERAADNPWPQFAFTFKTSSSHEEGGERKYSMLTKKFEDDGNGNVAALHAVEIRWSAPDENGRRAFEEVPATEMRIPCELVLLAMGFTRPEADPFVKELGLELEKNRFGEGIRGGDDFRTSRDKIFVAGDARRGQSLVVWAIHEGREAARAIDIYLMGSSDLAAHNNAGYDSVDRSLFGG